MNSTDNPWKDKDCLKNLFKNIDNRSTKLTFGYAEIGRNEYLKELNRLNTALKTETQFQRIYSDFLEDVENGKLTMGEARERMDALAMQRGFDNTKHFHDNCERRIGGVFDQIGGKRIIFRNAPAVNKTDKICNYKTQPEKIINRREETQKIFSTVGHDIKRNLEKDILGSDTDSKSWPGIDSKSVKGGDSIFIGPYEEKQTETDKEINLLKEGLEYGESHNKSKKRKWLRRLCGFGCLVAFFGGAYLINPNVYKTDKFERPAYEASARKLEKEILSPSNFQPLIIPSKQENKKDSNRVVYRKPLIRGDYIFEMDMGIRPVSADNKEIEDILLESYAKAVTNQNFLKDSAEAARINEAKTDSLSYFIPIARDSLRTDTLKQASLTRKIDFM